MLEFLPSFGSLITFGSVSSVLKKTIGGIGRHKAIAYSYVILVALLIAGAFLSGQWVVFPEGLFFEYLLQITMGGLGAIAMFKALDYGKAGIVASVSKSYVLLVMLAGIFFLGEEISAVQIAGSMLIVVSTAIISLDSRSKFRFEKWMAYLGFSMLCRTYYYTFIKTFVVEFGAFPATVLLECGIAGFIIGFHLLRGRDLALPSAGMIGLPVAAGILIFAGTVLYSVSVAWIGAALTAVIGAGTPIVNAVASYFLLKERLDMQKYAAIALTVLGLVLIFI